MSPTEPWDYISDEHTLYTYDFGRLLAPFCKPKMFSNGRPMSPDEYRVRVQGRRFKHPLSTTLELLTHQPKGNMITIGF